jgi:hypothetical protein
MSSGLFPNTTSESGYRVPILPSDSIISDDPYMNWKAFAPPPLATHGQPAPIKYGQDHLNDTPVGQRFVGSLEASRIMAPSLRIPSIAPPPMDIDTVEATEAVATPVVVEKQQAGKGHMRRTEHIAPHALPAAFAGSKLIF